MTTPDLAALRALVEAVGTTLPRAPRLAHADDCGCDDLPHARGWNSERLIELTEWRTSLGPIWTTAQAALGRMETLTGKYQDARQEIIERVDELATVKDDYERTCGTIALMHAAAVGDITGPRRGVVEDVADMAARVTRLESALLTYGQHDPQCPIWATQTRGTCTCGLDAALEGRDA